MTKNPKIFSTMVVDFNERAVKVKIFSPDFEILESTGFREGK